MNICQVKKHWKALAFHKKKTSSDTGGPLIENPTGGLGRRAISLETS
jgi:hypothetical protein